jgi:hypothetical protein
MKDIYVPVCIHATFIRSFIALASNIRQPAGKGIPQKRARECRTASFTLTSLSWALITYSFVCLYKNTVNCNYIVK